jgi:hypothetical protein
MWADREAMTFTYKAIHRHDPGKHHHRLHLISHRTTVYMKTYIEETEIKTPHLLE